MRDQFFQLRNIFFENSDLARKFTRGGERLYGSGQPNPGC